MNTYTRALSAFQIDIQTLPLRRVLRQSAQKAWCALPRLALSLSVPIGILFLWQIAYSREWLPAQILPSPAQTWATFLELYEGGELKTHLLVSLRRVAWSVAVGGSVGLIIGFAIGLSSRVKAWLYPSFEVFAQFPVIGWVPLLMLFLGIDEGLKITAIAFAVVVPVVINTYKGILAIPVTLLEAGRVFAFNHRQTLLRIAIPAALPTIFSGIRQGVMQAWLSLVFVELLTASEGLGYLMVWARQLMQLDIVLIAIIIIGAVGYALDWSLRRIESHFNAWNPKGL